MADKPGAGSEVGLSGWWLVSGWLSGVARSAARLPLRRLRPGFGPFLDQPSSKGKRLGGPKMKSVTNT